jgi:hypothetical protein
MRRTLTLLTAFTLLLRAAIAELSPFPFTIKSKVHSHFLTTLPYNYINIMNLEIDNITTPETGLAPEIEFHDTVQRTNPPSDVDTRSIQSQLLPTNLESEAMSITIGGISIRIASEEKARSTTGALYTKEIRKSYDDDKKGKLDLLKLVQSRQQQPYVAISISVNDPEKLLNHYSLSKLNKECHRNLTKYDLAGPFKIVFPIALEGPTRGQLKTDASGNYISHNILDNCLRVTAQQVADSSRWYSGFTHEDSRFQEDLEWSLAYFENNVDSALYARIHSKILTFDERSRGGPLFFKLLNDETTTTSDSNKKALITIVDTYKIRTSCKGERIPDVVDLFRSITDTVYALHDDSLPDEYVTKLITIFGSTSVPDFNDLFDDLAKQLFAAELQASITCSLIVPTGDKTSLQNNLVGANYVLKYANTAFYTLSQRGAWDKCLQQVPGQSANVNPHETPPTGAPTPDTSAPIRCFNCDGNHHLRQCSVPRDHKRIAKARGEHPNGGSSQPTGFRGRSTRPTKWRFPEEGENGKRIIDNKPFTWNATTKRWEEDATPETGIPPQAFVLPPIVPPTPPPIPPATPSSLPTPDLKGAFFNGYGSPTGMDRESHKQYLALQMIQLKQAFESL